MNKRIVLLSVAVVSLACVGVGAEETSEKVLAQVGATNITVRYYQGLIDGAPADVKETILSQKDKFLNDLVNQELLYQEAQLLKLQQDPAVVAALERATKQIVIQRYLEKAVLDKVQVSDQEVKDFFDKNPDQFKTPEKVRAAHILVKDEALAKDLAGKIKAGADFGALAMEHSIDPSKVNGGDLGFFQRGQMVAPFEKVAFELKEGEISGVVPTQFGFHLIKVLKKEPAKVLAFQEIKEKLAQELLAHKQQQEVGRIFQELRKKTPVQTFPELLGQVK